MRFTTAIVTCLKKYATFSGTASRPEFWWFYLFDVLISLLTYFTNETISVIVSAALLIPTISSASRRLHDTDRSGWWQLIAFIPFLGIIVLVVFLVQKGKSNRYFGSNNVDRAPVGNN
ncbi:DUF805 domain-containing protein [Oxalobacteraceae sp. CFBP 8755]|nr:DUF805 domain-containing protein [Oxalobacteraceae sp. CFBP 8755]MBD8721751.1 DUF805 domain-containing protein [Oxalobacteraceae sp. CFBP 13708]